MTFSTLFPIEFLRNFFNLLDDWMYGWVDGWTDGWMDCWMDGSMEELID